MLKGQSLSSLVKKNNSWAIQVDHLTKSPTSIQTKIDPNFSAMLEANSNNPAKKYESEMRSMLKDDLASGVKTHTNSVMDSGIELGNRKRHYQQSLDGVLCQLEKNSFTYNLALQKKINRQEERKKLFVDQDKLKNSKIQSFIHKREDKDVFNRQSDVYQSFQKQEHQNTMEWLKIQKEFKIKNDVLRDKQKQKQVQNRLLYQKQLELKNYQQIKDKMETQRRYGNQLHSLAEERRYRESIKGTNVQTSNRHNPITNPIEYHIQNPYFLKRMEQRNNGKF